ncbi:uncharacterized protein [Nyctibius grandis]|uniref:uncharacterized protein isoform X1 n=1 Tax=Nyctibius grandis TaxID=48427 RepID=UPI0035BBE0DD
MGWRAAAAAPLLLGHLSLLPLPLGGAQEFWGFELQQPQDKVWVTAGETLTLTCTVSGDGPNGPVKWLKGWGSGNETIYDQTGSFPRVTRAVSESGTDFTIHIRDVQPEDAGTYYCVKFRKMLEGVVVFQRGAGTEVSLHGECSPAGPHPTAPSLPTAGSRAAPRPPPSPRSALYLPRDSPASRHGGCSCSALPPPLPRPLRRPLHVQEEAQRRGREPVPGRAGGPGQLLAHPSAVLCRDPQHPQQRSPGHRDLPSARPAKQQGGPRHPLRRPAAPARGPAARQEPRRSPLRVRQHQGSCQVTCGTAAREPISAEEAGTFLQGTIKKKWICLRGSPQPQLSTAHRARRWQSSLSSFLSRSGAG